MPLKKNQGIEVEDVHPGSPAANAGIVPGDTLISINGNCVSDVIDYCFFKSDFPLRLEFLRNGVKSRGRIVLEITERKDPGIQLRHFKVRTCTNKCLFCFVAQLPKGLRRSLYVKDEDYRMSFLYGNYITMTNLAEADKKRIVEERLSPLYISVHATNRKIRNYLLGKPDAADILEELRFLKKNRIFSHVQIVLCPGINDDGVLEKTIRDLEKFHPYVSSIAVVPVGLTEHRKRKMRPVLREDAEEALGIIVKFQKRFSEKYAENFLFGADELYIKAGREMPPLADYRDLPQLENGVGMVPLFIHEAKKLRPKALSPERAKLRYLTFTGLSFHPFLEKYLLNKLRKRGYHITALPVENRFFGTSVTVTGLLTGKDVVNSLSSAARAHDILLVPDTVMRDGGDMFLDDMTLPGLEKALGIKTVLFEAGVRGFMEAISNENT